MAKRFIFFFQPCLAWSHTTAIPNQVVGPITSFLWPLPTSFDVKERDCRDELPSPPLGSGGEGRDLPSKESEKQLSTCDRGTEAASPPPISNQPLGDDLSAAASTDSGSDKDACHLCCSEAALSKNGVHLKSTLLTDGVQHNCQSQEDLGSSFSFLPRYIVA